MGKAVGEYTKHDMNKKKTLFKASIRRLNIKLEKKNRINVESSC